MPEKRSRNNLLHRQLDICADIFVYSSVDNTPSSISPFHDDSSTLFHLLLLLLSGAHFFLHTFHSFIFLYIPTFTFVGLMWWMPKCQKCRIASTEPLTKRCNGMYFCVSLYFVFLEPLLRLIFSFLSLFFLSQCLKL